MTVKINADTSDGLKFVSDTSGAIDFQSNGSTKMSMDASGNLTANSFVGSALKLLHVRDEKSATTNGGDAAAGTDNIRVLNTVVTNEITGASLASNRITLPAGTYYCDATAPVFSVNMHRAFLYNVTDSSVTLLGIPQYATSFSALGGNNSVVMGRFTISGEKVFEIRHRTESAKATNGLGNDMNDGRLSIYTTVVIRKVS